MTDFKKSMKHILAIILVCIIQLSLSGVYTANAEGNFILNAVFENEKLQSGENHVKIIGSNNSLAPQPLTIILAIYTGNQMKDILVLDKGLISAGSVFTYNESIVPVNTADIENSVLTVYFFKDINNIQPISKKVINVPQGFEFTLDKDCTVSAGVYMQDDTLIKTLWSAKEYTAGTHAGFWDGTNDDGQIVPDDRYKIKVLSSNVKCEFEGLIGNNETFQQSNVTAVGYGFYGGMALAGTKMYTTSQYSEGNFGLQYFDINNPHLREGYLGIRNMQANKVATDGQRVYWGSQEQTYYSSGVYQGKNVMTGFVHATNVSNNSKYTFPQGTTINSIWSADNMYSAANVVTGYVLTDTDTQDKLRYDTDGSRLGGIAVQKNGNYLFSTFPNINKVYAADKLSGAAAPVPSATLTSPLGIAVDADDNVWISYDNNGSKVVSCFTVSSAGELQSVFTLPFIFAKPLALAVSPNGSTIMVADGGNVNKIYAFNTGDGSLKWSYGSGESYRTDPTVKEDKLLFRQYFRSIEWIEYSFLAFQDDNTLWFGDVGNFRARKLNISNASLSTSPVIADTLSYLQNSYSCNVDLAAPSRVFSDALEFEIDYSKENIKEAWRLKNNWTLSLEDKGKIRNSGIFKDITTLCNNRTYFTIILAEIVNNVETSRSHIYELMSDSVRDTGIVLDSGYILRADGSLTKIDRTTSSHKWLKRNLTGFDSNNNPLWGADTILAEIPYNATEPFYNNSLNHTFAISSNNILISHREYANYQSDIEKTDMRLGGIKLGNGTASKWLWKANPTTSKNYYRDFPSDGYYDIGNGVWSTSSKALTLGRNVIHQYYGEGYRGAQTDKFTHFYDDGLLIGVYGETGLPHDGPLIPGNGFSWNLLAHPTNPDIAYIYQNDEARCGGVHRYKLTGLSSINEQTIDFNYINRLSQGALTYEVFQSADFDSATLVKKGVASSFGLNNIITDSINQSSVRYSGFIKPDSDAQYTFVARTTGYAKIWVDNKIIMQGTSIRSSSPVTLKGGVLYPVKIELSKLNGTWSDLEFAINRITSLIPFQMFYAYFTDLSAYNSANLLEGLPFGNTLQDDTPRLGITTMPFYLTSGQYGWTMSPALNYTLNSLKIWTVKTNGTAYKRDEDNDIFINSRSYGKSHADYLPPRYISRNLGIPPADGWSNWSLDANITITGWLNNGTNGEMQGNFGQYLDILDIYDKVIARFYIVCIMSQNTVVRYEVYGNRGLIYQTANVEGRYISKYSKHPFNIPSPLKISCNGTVIKFEYLGGSVTTSVFETGSNSMKPKTFRVTHFNEKPDYNNIGVETDIINLYFRKS